MPRKIWVFTEPYYPDEVASGYILTKIAEGLAESCPVEVLCSQPNFRSRGVRAPVHEIKNGVKIERCKSTTLSNHKLKHRLVNNLTFSFSIFFKGLARVRSEDIVILVTSPPLIPMVGAIICRLRRAKCLLIVHDVSPEVLVATEILSPASRLYRLIEGVSKRLYSRFDRIVVIGRDMHQLVLAKSWKLKDRLVIIPNWADLDLVEPGDRTENALLKEAGLTEKFVLLHAGNMGRTHGLEAIVEAARQLTGTDAHFLFIGTGAKKAWLEKTVESEEIPNITVMDNRPRNDQSNFLNACDVAIISFISGMSGISVPSRMYNVMAAGKPIIAVTEENSELAQVVMEEEIGWVVPPGKPERLIQAVREAQANPGRLQEMGIRARKVAEEKYSLGRILSKFRNLIHDMEAGTFSTEEREVVSASRERRRIR